MEILSTCEANYDSTGAAITATIFLVVFVLLLVFDGVLTALALRSAISPDVPFIKCCIRKGP
tara:strand:+ start:67 stop:252 length:186 start_codon:yes stop_codon:yes gene_type:complete